MPFAIVKPCWNCGEDVLYQNGLCFGCFNDPHMEVGHEGH